MRPIHRFKLSRQRPVVLYQDHFEYVGRQYPYTPLAFDQVMAGVDEKKDKASQYDLALLAGLCINTSQETIGRIRTMLRFEKMFLGLSYGMAMVPVLFPGALNIGVKGSAMLAVALVSMVAHTAPALVAAWSNMTKKKIFRNGIDRLREA